MMIVAALAATLPMSPAPAAAPEGSSASQRLDEGRMLHDAENYDGAIRIYESILRDEPDNPHAFYEMAFSRYTKGEYAAAIPLVQKAIEGDKGDLAAATRCSATPMMSSRNGSRLRRPSAEG
jgi:tetratricopeptide (TPR) repeat protein